MDNSMQHLGERWLYIFAIIQNGNFTYDGTKLKVEDEIFISKEEIEGAIKSFEEIRVSPDTDQSHIDALECLNLIKEKIGG